MEEQKIEQKKSMNPMIIVVVVLLLLGGGWLVMSKSTSPSVQPTPTAAADKMTGEEKTESPTEAMTEQTTVSPSADAMGVKEVVVQGKNFSFTPAEIKVKKGDKVKITFKNTGGFHNFMLDYNGKTIGTKTIKADESDSFEFTADTVGSFDYYCSVGNHRQMGMAGKLVVE